MAMVIDEYGSGPPEWSTIEDLLEELVGRDQLTRHEPPD